MLMDETSGIMIVSDHLKDLTPAVESGFWRFGGAPNPVTGLILG